MSDFEIISFDGLFEIFSYLTVSDFLNFTKVTGYPFRTYLKNKDELHPMIISYYLYTKCRSEELFIYLRECFNITIPLEYQLYKFYKCVSQEKSDILALKCAIQLRDLKYIESASILIENKFGGYPENWASATCCDYRKVVKFDDSIPGVFNSLLYVANGDGRIENMLWNRLKWFVSEGNYITYYEVTDGYNLTVRIFHNDNLEREYCIENYFS